MTDTSNAAASAVSAPAAPAAGTPIHRPPAGATVIAEVNPNEPLKLDFASTDGKFVALDVDLVIMFPDGGKIVLPGYAFGLVSGEIASAEFSDRTVSAEQFLAQLSDLRLLDDNALPTAALTASAVDQGKGSGKGDEAAPPTEEPPPAPPAPSARIQNDADFPASSGGGDDNVQAVHATDASAAAASSGSPPSSASHFTGDGNGSGNILAAKLDITLLGVSGDKIAPTPAGGEEIRGAASVVAATTDPAFAVQQQTKTLIGTAGDDVIYAADPRQMPAGTFERLIDVRAEFPVAGAIAQTATINSLPAGFAINNAARQGDDWILNLDPTDPNHLQLQLVYTLPHDTAAPSANGVFSSFTLSILFEASLGGASDQFQGTQTFVVKYVTSDDDVVSGGANGQAQIYALNANPPGTDVQAGAGNDTVYSGPGADTLDGGPGDNLLSYAYSQDGVTVNLQTGVGSGGYAAGDVVSHFDQIQGSPYADYLVGLDAGHVTFLGSGGADTLVGQGDDNTVDYSASTAGVSVNLTTGVGLGGLADGNRLVDIANVIGSATGANTLVGATGANLIVGGGGGDTIDGKGGPDTIEAGAGDDRVSFYGSEASIDGGGGLNTLVMAGAADVNLADASRQVAGVVTLVVNFENVDASALTTGVTLTGASGANTILGGGGGDTIDGAGGHDVIQGGAGDDQIVYHGSEASIDGGAGNNTLVVEAQTNIDLSAPHQAVGQSTLVSNFENVDASALSASQAVSLKGSSLANVILGGAGDDTIDGGGGADSIHAGAGDDVVSYHGTESLIDGGAGANTLVMLAVANVNLAHAADQTSGDATTVVNFQSVDASALTVGVDIVGSTGPSALTGGAGDDTIDGAGGADIIRAGAGDDTVAYHGTEVSIDGGRGDNTLILAASGGMTAIDLSVAPGADQTVGDTAVVTNFQNVDASALTAPLALTGSVGANVLIGGGGGDTIDGRGGADVIAAGAGDDFVDYYGGETSIDGGGGVNTLVLRGVVTVDLADSADQTSGDGVVVVNFENVDASRLSQGVSLTGSSGPNVLTGGAGNDTIDGGGGQDVISAGAGDDLVAFHGSEASLDGGSGDNTLLMYGAANVDLAATADQVSGVSTLVTNFSNVNAAPLTSGVSILGASDANTILGGGGGDTIDGGGGRDVIEGGAGDDVVTYHGTEGVLDGGGGSNTLAMLTSGGVTRINLNAGPGADETAGDSVDVTNFQNIDAHVLTTGVAVTGSAYANVITTGSGDDTIDGGGGDDVIQAGAGDDVVSFYGTETRIDGGAGNNSLVLKAAVAINLADAADQASGVAAIVVNFENIDASHLSQGVSLTGDAGANLIAGGAGADTIDGGGGRDTINAGGGDDLVDYHGTEVSIDGGAGENTLKLVSPGGITEVNLAAAPGSDETLGGATFVANFQSVDATILTTAVAVTGSSGANTILTGAGDDTIDGGGGADAINAGAGDNLVYFHGSEVSIAAGAGDSTLDLMTAVAINLAATNEAVGASTIVANFQSVDAAALRTGVVLTGSNSDNTIVGGAGDDTIDGGGGADSIDAGAGADTVYYHGAELTIDGGTGSNTLIFLASGGVTRIDLSVAPGVDETTGDHVAVLDFENIDAGLLTNALYVRGSAAANVIATGTGADTIDGGGGDDVINAGGGGDTVYYYGSEISIAGGAGDNTLALKAGATINLADATDQASGGVTVTGFNNVDASSLATGVSLTGTAGANVLTGGGGADTIDGGGGQDVIAAGGGDDVVDYYGAEISIDGGAGSNMLALKAPGGITEVDFTVAPGVDQTIGDNVDVTNFEGVDASILTTPLLVKGTVGANTIIGGGGDDTIHGGGGPDVIAAGAGDDVVDYWGTEVSIDGGAGVNTLVLDASGGVTSINFAEPAGIDETVGDHVVVTNFQNLLAGALTSSLTVTGSAGANTIATGSGDDTIDGGGGGDVIDAGAGDDLVAYRGGEASIDGGAGVNTLKLYAAVAVNLADPVNELSSALTSVVNFQNVDASPLAVGVALTGSSAANTIVGGAGDDTIDGGGGPDVISAGAGNDEVVYHGTEISIDGGAGDDTLILQASGGVTAVDFAVASGADQTLGDNVLVRNFENLDAHLLTTALTVTGASNANAITTGAGDDTIHGGGGADAINAGAGDDRVDYWGSEVSIDGGAGVNTLALAAPGVVNLAHAADQTSGDLTIVVNFQSVDASGLLAGVSLTGSAGPNLLLGGAGADTIDGGGGADTINAGAGDDIVDYHGTEVSIDGGAGANTLNFLATGGVTAVNLAVAAGQDETVGDNTLVMNFSSVNAAVFTTPLTLTGSAGANTLIGGGGGDTIDGEGGGDVILGGDGNNTIGYHGSEVSIDGGAGGNNTLVLASAVAVNLANASDQTSGDNVTVTNFANINASTVTTGLSLTGSSAANLIIGGSGNDTIAGGGGADTLIGGAGNDTFSLDASSLGLGAKATGNSNGNTLEITGSATVTDTELAASLTRIQNIDFSGGTATANLHLSGATVAQIDGAASNTLTVTLNASDSVVVSDPIANYTSTVSGVTTSYTIYDDALHTHVIAHLAVVA